MEETTLAADAIGAIETQWTALYDAGLPVFLTILAAMIGIKLVKKIANRIT